MWQHRENTIGLTDGQWDRFSSSSQHVQAAEQAAHPISGPRRRPGIRSDRCIQIGEQPEFLFYETGDGRTRLQVRMEGETVWLSQRNMAELFQTTKQNVSLHIQNIFDEREVTAEATVKKYLTVQTEGSRRVERSVDHYNLDVIIRERRQSLEAS